jgi:formyl-CoA transferase
MSDGKPVSRVLLRSHQFEAGLSCTEALAWLGADVVGWRTRAVRSHVHGGLAGKDDPYFLLFNANKKSITVNLEGPEGACAGEGSRRKADVMENFAPARRAAARRGRDYKINRRSSLPGFGEGSSYEKNLAFDMIAQACGGTMSTPASATGAR